MKTNKHIKPNMKNIYLSLAFLATALAAHAQSWTNRFDGPLAGNDAPAGVVVDAAGDVLVTGYTDDGGDNFQYATIKYSSAGIPIWTNYYPGLANENARAKAIALDTNGNVFVTGQTEPKIFDPGSTIGDYVTIKYSSLGSPLWTNRYNGANYPDYAAALVVDGGGNVIVTGTSYGQFTDEDWASVKYSGAGATSWTRAIRISGQDQAVGLAVDGAGNVIVAGLLDGAFRTIKYSPSGGPLWTNRYVFGLGQAVAVDSNTNVFVTGWMQESGGIVNDVATIKYSSSGVPLWTNRWTGGNWCPALVVDSNDDVIIAPKTSNGASEDYFAIKYSNSGVPLWTNRCGPAPQQFSSSMGPFLKVDGSGNVFFAGTSGTNYGTEDWLTIKYSAAGVPLWTNRYAGPAGGSDMLSGLAVESNGNAFVTGWSWNGTKADWVTIKYAAEVAPPTLNIQRLGNSVILNWTNAAFALQSTPAITGTFTNVPGATSPYSNSLSGGQRFFRLISN